MLHTVVFDISTEEYNRVNRLLEIPSLSEMSDEQLLSAGANTDWSEGILYVEFDDGSTLSYDLCSGQENYFDDVVWTNPDNTQDVLLECTFELDDIEFTAPNGEDYAVKLNIRPEVLHLYEISADGGNTWTMQWLSDNELVEMLEEHSKWRIRLV